VFFNHPSGRLPTLRTRWHRPQGRADGHDHILDRQRLDRIIPGLPPCTGARHHQHIGRRRPHAAMDDTRAEPQVEAAAALVATAVIETVERGAGLAAKRQCREALR
jgi:hypothetical protein